MNRGSLGDSAEDCSVRGLRVGVRRAFQLANIPVEGQQIVGQQLVERVEFRVEFRVQRVDPAIESPPHRAQGAQDREEGGQFCPVHGSAIADPRWPRHVNRVLPFPLSTRDRAIVALRIVSAL